MNSKLLLVFNLYKRSLLFCLLILCFSISAEAKLVTTYSVNSSTMKKIEEWADKNTIFFVELDDTLLMPKSAMFSFDSNPYRMFINDMVSLGARMSRYNTIVAQWYQQRQVKLVEEAWVDFIKRLQAKGVTVYGFCSMPIHLLKIEEKRYIEAKNLGVVFTSKVNGQENLDIEKKERWYSSFHKGIIFTGPYSKSHTLMEFLKITNLSPKKLAVIDNIEYKLKRIDRSLRVFDMEFYNVLYLGAREVIGRPDADIVSLQQRELIKNGKWLEDEEAKALLKTLKEQQAATETK